MTLVLGRNFKAHLDNLREVFQRFREYSLRMKQKKCVLFREEVEFFDRLVGQGGLQLTNETVAVVLDWPKQKCTRDVERFLGLVNYHRLFLKDLVKVAVPLYERTGKQKFRWKEEQEEAFKGIKEVILDTDASEYAVGAELIQVQEGLERVVAYGSYALSHEQRRYCITRQELLAVVRLTRQYRHYLLGRKFTVRADHHSLLWANSKMA